MSSKKSEIPIKTVNTDALKIAYFDDGPAGGPVVILLHGFPYDPSCFDTVVSELVHSGFRCIRPYLRGYGPTEFLSKETMRSGQQAALAVDLRDFMNALSIERATLAGFDWGGRAACIVAAIWPRRVVGLVSSGTGYNIQDIPAATDPLDAEVECRLWYQYYFHSRRGYLALQRSRRQICRFLWANWSPSWHFDEATYDQVASTFDNTDFPEVVVHCYRHRFGLVAGDPRYEEIERLLAKQPKISVPSILLEGMDDAVDRPVIPDVEKHHFSGYYMKLVVLGVGHNIPQEAPTVFARAVRRIS